MALKTGTKRILTVAKSHKKLYPAVRKMYAKTLRRERSFK